MRCVYCTTSIGDKLFTQKSCLWVSSQCPSRHTLELLPLWMQKQTRAPVAVAGEYKAGCRGVHSTMAPPEPLGSFMVSLQIPPSSRTTRHIVMARPLHEFCRETATQNLASALDTR